MVKKKQPSYGTMITKPGKDKPKKIKKENSGTVTKGAAEYLATKEKKIVKAYKDNYPNKRWWLEDAEKIHTAVANTIQLIEMSQTARRLLNIRFARLYGNYDAIGFSASSLNRANADGLNASNPIRINIIQSVIDAVAAKVAKDQPKVSFVTTGADDYFLKLRATNLTKYITGLFKESKLYENSELVFRDAEVVGTGHLKIFEEDNKIKTEWCFQDEIRVDEMDGIKQKPRSMHQTRLIARDQLLAQFPEHEQHIVSTQSALQGKLAYQSTTDVVKVYESWHLPAHKDAGDGVHCITIDNCTLLYEEYKKDYFPIVTFRWMNRPLGYFGRSISEEIATIQVEINKIMVTIQQAQELAAIPIIFVPSEAEVSEDILMQNSICRLVPYSGGNPPNIVSPQALSPEVYNHLNSLIQWAFQMVGLSQTSASGMKPAGVDSAVAIREVADIETGRFAQVAKRWEDFFMECARVMVDMSKDMYERNPDLGVTYNEKKILKEIRWKDVDLQDNPFDIQTFPTSQLPDTPAGRIQTVTEYIQNNWISKERGMELLNLDPDLEQEVNIQTASLRLTEKWLSEMVEDGKYHKPEPFMNLVLAQQIAQGIYNMLLHDGCPEDRLDLVRDFIMECIEMLKPPPAPPPPPEEMGPPPGPPGMPPPGMEGMPPMDMTQPPPPPQPPMAPQPPPYTQ